MKESQTEILWNEEMWGYLILDSYLVIQLRGIRTSRKNSLELMELPSINKVSLV
jgi:hypothetical protein